MIYVDDFYRYEMSQYGRMRMSHLIADSTDELLEFVTKLGLDKKYIQYPGTYREHFDISKKMRKIAIEVGATEITYKELGKMIQKRKIT